MAPLICAILWQLSNAALPALLKEMKAALLPIVFRPLIPVAKLLPCSVKRQGHRFALLWSGFTRRFA